MVSEFGSKSRSLGYAHWPELGVCSAYFPQQSRSLGYAHWPEHALLVLGLALESRSLGYAHWPERVKVKPQADDSLDHWDMRTGRNYGDMNLHTASV